jgi:GTP-binding protein Era
MHRSGFVSIVGRPNAGKSTLLNALVGMKLAAVADKPQTTRTTIQGVWTTPEAQVIFVDTPGIHRSDTPFNKRMMSQVRSALEERDLLLYLVDATAANAPEEEKALDGVKKTDTPAFLVLTKVDRLNEKQRLLPIMEKFKALHDFADYFPISAVTGDGMDALRAGIVSRMPEHESFYPADYITDQPERFLAAELIREQILRQTHQEVPHSVAVIVDVFEEKKTLTKISATIYVEREGQKAIIIGSKGGVLKSVGSAARKEIEVMLDRKVFLELFVKVRANWREDPEFLNELDWRNMSGSEVK